MRQTSCRFSALHRVRKVENYIACCPGADANPTFLNQGGSSGSFGSLPNLQLNAYNNVRDRQCVRGDQRHRRYRWYRWADKDGQRSPIADSNEYVQRRYNDQCRNARDRKWGHQRKHHQSIGAESVIRINAVRGRHSNCPGLDRREDYAEKRIFSRSGC